MIFPEFRPTASLSSLRLRATILKHIRQFFDNRDFFEVQTPVLSSETVVDAHLDPIIVDAVQIAGVQLADSQVSQTHWYLQTSPELLMKRLLASGAHAIYQIGPAFRAGELGQFHNPEFTMVEWYRTGDSIESGVKLLSELTETLLPMHVPVRSITYANAFVETLGFDPFEISDEQILHYCSRLIQTAPVGLDRDGMLEWLFSETIQPRLANNQAVIVTHYPATQSALAQLSPTIPHTAERFELFVNGVELANGYGELLDAEILRRRVGEQNLLRLRRGANPLPAPEKLLSAMSSGLPACSGCALGIDRLLMVLAKANSLSQVLAFPASRV